MTAGHPTPEQARVFQAFMALTDMERRLIMCWFCHHCGRHFPPGDPCECHCCDEPQDEEQG